MSAVAFTEYPQTATPSPPSGERLRLGSPEHKALFCNQLLETHDPYKPAIIDWPKLDEETRGRIVSLPIWDIAVQTEEKAGWNVRSYGARISDPLLKAAVAMDAFEESRHKLVLSHMVQAYGIKLDPEPPYLEPRDPEWAYLVTGFSECIDSFFAFGLFELAKQSGYFPGDLVETFEPVIQEEARHILLFANWLAWHRRRMHWWMRPWFEMRVAAVWVFLIWERIGLAKSVDSGGGNQPAQDNNFTVSGSKSVSDVDIKPGALMGICLAENDRRFAGYDARLLRPTTVPRLTRFARWFLRG